MTTRIKKYNFSEKDETSFSVDTNGYVWVGFAQDASGNCAFQKRSASNPSQKYYDIDIAVSEIKASDILSSYIYLAFDDTSLIGRRYSLTNPLSTYTNFSIPSGISQKPINVIAYGSYVYFLLPGNTSGTNAKVCKFQLDGTFEETIDLSTVSNAISMTIDTDVEELWVVTNTNPVNYVRVWQMSGGIYTYTVNN